MSGKQREPSKPPKPASLLKDRIVGHGRVAVEKLKANPNNWRSHSAHQRDAMTAILEEVGWVQTVIVNKTTGNLADGHLRSQIAA